MRKQLRWNKFPILFSAEDLVLVFDVEITSKALSVPVISKGQQDRHELMQKLHEEGFSDADIVEYMNEDLLNQSDQYLDLWKQKEVTANPS